MSRLPDPSSARLRQLIAMRSGTAHGGGKAEAIEELAAAGPGASDLTGQVEARMHEVLERVPADEVGDRREFSRALGIMLAETLRTARKLDADPNAPLSRSETLALEAVIRTNGSRPSLLVRKGRVDAGHPLVGDWGPALADTAGRLRGPLDAVGRIEPADGSSRNFFGTGWVVDADAGLVLTNLHVLEAMQKRLPNVMLRRGAGFRILGGAFIDFAAEAGATEPSRFRVVEATPSGIDGPGLARMDAALLRIEPDATQVVPAAIRPTSDPDGPRGVFGSFCVVGVPGPPPFTAGLHEGVDWTWVNSVLFGNRFGVKRLAPGVAHKPLGTIEGDPRRWVFGHDATTLGGSSGSALLSWLDAEPTSFGLHFAGASVDTNYAHAVSECSDPLRAMGVSVWSG